MSVVEFQTEMKETSRLCVEERPGPCRLVILGASGDLAKRKLIPALYNLHKRGLLPEKFGVVGFARSEMGDDELSRFSEASRTRRADIACMPSEILLVVRLLTSAAI